MVLNAAGSWAAYSVVILAAMTADVSVLAKVELMADQMVAKLVEY